MSILSHVCVKTTEESDQLQSSNSVNLIRKLHLASLTILQKGVHLPLLPVVKWQMKGTLSPKDAFLAHSEHMLIDFTLQTRHLS
jgi:hypothetical protein